MAITMTEGAAKRAAEILAEEAKRAGKEPDDFYLRLKVTGGGCSGFMHELESSSDPIGPHDREFICGEVRIVVDAKSYIYVNGTEIDYETMGLQTGFVIKNPNSKSSCGCGQSHTF
ncbi:MAG: iron-sulfur cluster assembly accessory protein [bacterium]|nr:iron-sulfur cluster assembly accessory protein [bacterium]